MLSDCECLGDTPNDDINPLVGNRVCDDETNNLDCDFDGGDCCLFPKNTENCLNCSCSVPGIIIAPGFGYQEVNTMDLSWLIQVNPGRFIEIEFLFFYLHYCK